MKPHNIYSLVKVSATVKNYTVNAIFPIWPINFPIYVSKILNRVPKCKSSEIKT